MIDVKAYIESGVLEDYLGGNVSEQERREVECLSKIYPEIKTELDQIADTLEGLARAQAVKPPAALKDKIMAQLEFEDAPEENEQEEAEEAPVIPLNARPQGMQWRWLAAASVVGLIGVGVYFNARVDELSQKVALQTTELHQKNEWIAALNRAENQFVTLKGLDKSPSSSVRVVWNPTTQEVALNVLSLPQPATDKQYQLWALVDGKPVDLGVFDVKDDLQKMKLAAKADAFAVTLEKKGGSPTPTLTELYVMGKVG
ncbi:MAG: anti-sigma factor [Spirosomaceae bacterium]|jgi:anti-sigma-K factor RskA|nr:anti-sigma factor [Spirosomataceae bacterium]